jgi:hypothetical protein
MFPYFGSKWNIARYFPAPKHHHVVEPFAGSAGYASFYGASTVTLIDADPIIAGLWKFLKRTTPREIMALPEMPEAGDNVDNYNIHQEAKWLIGFWLNRGSASPKKSRTAYSARSDRGQLNWSLRAKERIASQLHLLEDWTIIEGSYDQAPNVTATWLVDPPYAEAGKYYRTSFSDYPALGRWCNTRSGTLIACEAGAADWLPFKPLGNFKSSKGRSSEYLYTHENKVISEETRPAAQQTSLKRHKIQLSLFGDEAPLLPH